MVQTLVIEGSTPSKDGPRILREEHQQIHHLQVGAAAPADGV